MIDVLGVGAAPSVAPSFRVRILLPSAHLIPHGVRLRPLSLLGADPPLGSLAPVATTRRLLGARRALARRLDESPATVSLISRQVDLLPLPSLERRAMRGRRVIYDVDDAIWVSGRQAGGHPLAFLKASKHKAAWLAARADHVLAGNAILAEWLAPHASEVSVIPSLIDTDAAPQKVDHGQEGVVIGWIGSPTTAGYLERLRRPLEAAVQASRTPITLLVVGGTAPFMRGVNQVHQPWTPSAEAAALSGIDIGVMPLPDTEWTRGKCAYKAIQYMASGIPVLADDVGVTGSVVGDGGLVLRNESEWSEGILELLTNAAMRQRLGDAGKARASEHFSVKAWAPRIARVLEGRER